MLTSRPDVIRALLTYTDWWQPSTGSILQVGAARRARSGPDGFHPGLLESLDERAELCRRVQHLNERDRHLLFLWYMVQLPVGEIARVVGISRRHCFRRRSEALTTLVRLGEPSEAA